MSKNLSAKYYQENKDYKKKARKRYQSLSKKEKEKNDYMVVNDTKIFQKVNIRNYYKELIFKKVIT